MSLLWQTIIALAVIDVCFLALGTFVAFQKIQPDIKWTFVLYTLSLSIWTTGQAAAMYLPDHDLSLLAVRFCHIGVVMIPIFLVHFLFCLSGVAKEKHRLIRNFYVVGVFFEIANTTPLYIRDVTLRPHWNLGYIFEPAVLYHVFLLFWFYTAIYGFVIMFKAYRRAEGQRRNQLQYLLWGMLPGYLGGIPNYLFGYDIVIPVLMPYGTYLFAFYVAMTAYAIVRHGFLDIEVIIKRTLVFAGLVGSVVAVVSLVAFVSQDVLARFIQIPKWLSNVLAAVIIAGLYGPIRNWLTNVTDRYLFQKRYDYPKGGGICCGSRGAGGRRPATAATTAKSRTGRRRDI